MLHGKAKAPKVPVNLMQKKNSFLTYNLTLRMTLTRRARSTDQEPLCFLSTGRCMSTTYSTPSASTRPHPTQTHTLQPQLQPVSQSFRGSWRKKRAQKPLAFMRRKKYLPDSYKQPEKALKHEITRHLPYYKIVISITLYGNNKCTLGAAKLEENKHFRKPKKKEWRIRKRTQLREILVQFKKSDHMSNNDIHANLCFQ